MAGEILQDGLQKIIFKDSEVKSNLGQIIVISTEDKIELCLIKYLKCLENKKSWITPLGLLLAITLTLLTADFKDHFFPKQTWQAIFIIADIIFFLWLIISSIKAFKTKTVKDVLEEIKKSSIKRNKEGKIDEDSI